MSSIPNIFIAVTLAIFVYNNKNWLAIFIALFLYSSLHYSFFLDHADLPLLPKLIGGIFVISAYIYLFTLPDMKAALHVLRSNVILQRNLLLLGVFIIANLIYIVINLIDGHPPSLLAIKTFLFSVITWLFACLSASIVLLCKITLKDKFKKQIVNGTLILLTVLTAVAVTEVWYGLSYAREVSPNGFVVTRANSFLYNPNVFGLWIFLYTVIVALLYNLRFYSKNKLMVLMFMTALSLVLSGSRAAFLTCLIMFFILFVAHLYRKGRLLSDDLLPIYCWLGFMILIMGTSLLLNYFSIHNSFNDSLIRNTKRFYDIPIETSRYAISRLGSILGYEVSFIVSDATISTFDGRINVLVDREGFHGFQEFSTKDNIYVAMLASGGLVGLLAWIMLWAYAIRQGFITLNKKTGVFSSYSLAMMISYAFIGLTMRTTQMFPVWVFISLPLSLCLAWFAFVHQENMNHDQNKNVPISSEIEIISK